MCLKKAPHLLSCQSEYQIFMLETVIVLIFVFVQDCIDKGANVNATDSTWFQYTALHWAATNGHVNAVRALLAAGVPLLSVLRPYFFFFGNK